MKIHYSPSENCCYLDGVHKRMPKDAREIDKELYAQVVRNRPLGKVVVPGADGLPMLADPSPKPLPDLIADLHARIDAWRDEQERGRIVFEHAGRRWDGGLAVRTRIGPVISLAALPPGFFWTDADNEDVPITLPELQALNAAHEAAIVARGLEIHVRQRQMKQEVAAMADPADVAAYQVGWPPEEGE